MGEKSNANIVCPVPVKPVDFVRMALEELQPPQRRHHLPYMQSSRMPPMNQQQQQKQMLADQAHRNQLQRQNRQIAYYSHMLTKSGLRQPYSWEQSLLQNSQSQQGQQHEQGQQAQHQQIQQHEQGVAEFRSNVLQTYEIIPLMAPGVQGDSPEDAAMQPEVPYPHFDEAQTQQALPEFDLFPSLSMETPPDNWEQQPQFQTNSEEADDEEPFQFFAPNADQMGLEEPRRQQAQIPAPQLISHMPGTHEEARRMWKLDQLQNGSLSMTPEEAQFWAEQSLCKW
ncbi:hypothetical protein F5X68DRAFT_234393 [Plectosphaerella plurivora]|uniref:Uncharacterized protein n=1 Tax=Plectosphaerella plurivora TaxID=936078 RepID=A0A9P8V7V9_9PEZI|nr:hypothetical protein F5X68DRAFT_234393 [Plectosphaerella plurivora]